MPGRRRRGRSARTPEAKQRYMISIAEDLVEQRILDGTATAQETTFYLKQGSLREQKELRKLEADTLLTEVKAEREAQAKDTEAMIADALEAMRKYTGSVEEYAPE